MFLQIMFDFFNSFGLCVGGPIVRSYLFPLHIRACWQKRALLDSANSHG